MNEDAKEEKSVLGKAVKMVAVGGLAAVGSGTAYSAYKGYKETTTGANRKGKIINNVDFKVSGNDVESTAKEVSNAVSNVKKSKFHVPIKPLTEEAMANQIHLDNLRKGLKDRRSGKKIADMTGKTRRTIKRVTKAL